MNPTFQAIPIIVVGCWTQESHRCHHTVSITASGQCPFPGLKGVQIPVQGVHGDTTLKVPSATYSVIFSHWYTHCPLCCKQPFDRCWLDSIQKCKNTYPVAQQTAETPHTSAAWFAGELTALVPGCPLWLHHCCLCNQVSLQLQLQGSSLQQSGLEAAECPKDKWENPTSWLAWAAIQAVQEWLLSQHCSWFAVLLWIGTIWFLKLEEKMNNEAGMERIGRREHKGVWWCTLLAVAKQMASFSQLSGLWMAGMA